MHASMDGDPECKLVVSSQQRATVALHEALEDGKAGAGDAEVVALVEVCHHAADVHGAVAVLGVFPVDDEEPVGLFLGGLLHVSPGAIRE